MHDALYERLEELEKSIVRTEKERRLRSKFTAVDRLLHCAINAVLDELYQDRDSTLCEMGGD